MIIKKIYTKEYLIVFLQKETKDIMSLEKLIMVFEQMCMMSINVDDDLILYEVGTYHFGDNPVILFSLTRQFPNEDDEYYQIHLDIHYEKNDNHINELEWSDSIQGDFFEYVRNSKAFQYFKNQKIISIDVYMDET